MSRVAILHMSEDNTTFVSHAPAPHNVLNPRASGRITRHALRPATLAVLAAQLELVIPSPGPGPSPCPDLGPGLDPGPGPRNRGLRLRFACRSLGGLL